MKLSHLIFLLFLLPFTPAFARDWEFKWVAGGNIRHLIHDGSEYLGINRSGGVASSPDGQSWTMNRGDVSPQDWVHHDGSYVQVSSRGRIYHSSNREDWTLIETGTTSSLRAVVHGKGRFLCVGDDGIMFSSGDGLSWEAVDSGTTVDFELLHFGAGRFVAVTDDNVILNSLDGDNWTATELTISVDFAAIASSEDTLFLASRRDTLSSTDGANWAVVGASTGFAREMVYGDGVLVRCGFRGALSYSSDFGVSWQDLDLGSEISCDSLVHGPEGFLLSAGRGILLSSPTGETWKQVSSLNPLKGIQDLIYDGRQFVGIVSGCIVTSPNGRKWTNQPRIEVSTNLNKIYFGNGQYISVGSPGKIAISDDLINWRDGSTGELELTSAAYGNGTWVVVAFDGPGLRSSDGISWTPLNLPAETALVDITFAEGKFVAVGEDALVAVSADGVTWETAILPGHGLFSEIAHTGDQWIASRFNSIVTSPNAVTWTEIGIGTFPVSTIAVNRADGEFLLAGSRGGVGTSADVSGDWIKRDQGNFEYFRSSAYGAGRFVIATTNQVFVTSSSVVNELALSQIRFTRTSDATALLTWDLDLGTNWEIWNSKSLNHDWERLPATIVEEGGEVKASFSLDQVDSKGFFQIRR